MTNDIFWTIIVQNIDKKVNIIKSYTDYAMRMLVYMAMKSNGRPVSAAVLVKTQKIPIDFAYKILKSWARQR